MQRQHIPEEKAGEIQEEAKHIEGETQKKLGRELEREKHKPKRDFQEHVLEKLFVNVN